MQRIGGWVMVACTVVAAMARADLIERTDGSYVAGRIIEGDGSGVTLRVGPGNEDTLELDRAKIKRVLEVGEELAANLQESSANTLETRAAAYQRAGLTFDALICLERAMILGANRPSSQPAKVEGDWPAFKAAAAISFASRRLIDSEQLLTLARQVAGMGDKRLCADLIHRAGMIRGGVGPARAAALELDVAAPPAHMIDLSPCLYDAAEVRSIMDEDVQVSAQPDRVFVHLPIRIDARFELSLSRGSLRGRDAKGLYGLRPMRLLDGRPSWEPRRGDPVYERLDFTPESGEFVFRNTTPAPRDANVAPPRDRASRELRLKSAPWICLILEVRQAGVAASVQLPGDVAEDLDLTLIRRGRDPLPEWSDPANPPPEQLVGVLERLERAGQAPTEKRESQRSTTLFALAKLEATRAAIGDRVSKEWRTLTDQAVVSALSCGDPVVSIAAWRYLAATPEGEWRRLAEIIAAQAHTHFALASAIEFTRRDPDRRIEAASRGLSVILSGDDAFAVARALDVLQRSNDRASWYALCDSNVAAKKLELARLNSAQPGGKHARWAVNGLVAGMDSDLAGPILAAARRFGVEITSAEDPVLYRWQRLEKSSARAAYLEGLALAGPGIAGVWHSPAISIIAHDVYNSRNKGILAGWNALVAAHRSATPGETRGMFPMLVARESADPDLLGLNAVASHGAPDDRRAAINSLLTLGYAEEVQRALGPDADRDWPMLLSTGVKKENELAILGLLARWSAGESPEIAAAAMVQLSRVLSEVPNDRSWQATAAIKSGLTIDALNDLSWGVDPLSSAAALRVAYSVGHMTQQERQRVAGAVDRAARLDEMHDVDLRRGQLVDGSYGVLAIVETTTRVNMNAGQSYWAEPMRTLVELPPLRLEVDEVEDKVTALLNGAAIGTGQAVAADRAIKPLAYYYGVMEALDGDEFVVRADAATTQPAVASRPTASRPAAVRAGPMVLPDTRARSGGAGLIALELGAFADTMSARTGTDKLNVAWPLEFPLSLRYHLWGTWVGCGRRQDLPATAQPGETRLLNIMVIVEKMSP